MGYVQADLKMNFSFEYDIDYSTFNIPIPTPPPLPPPLTPSTDSNLNTHQTNISESDERSQEGNESDEHSVSSEVNPNRNDETFADIDEMTMTFDNSESSNVRPEVLEEAKKFNFDIVRAWELDVDNKPDTPEPEEQIPPIETLPTEVSFSIS